MAMTAERDKNEKQLLCCLKLCTALKDSRSRDIDKDTDCRVEVKAFKPRGKPDKLNVLWETDGSAIFHQPCWSLLVKCTSGSTSSAIILTDDERSMILEAKKTAEFHDALLSLENKATRIAKILKGSKNSIAFTGAGISTAAGIGDFRGKEGKWTERDRVKNYGSGASPSKKGAQNLGRCPTFTHEALVKLVEMGILKFIISQNTDGLHRLSGIPEGNISELHGNTFIEKCEKCNKRYERNSPCRRLDTSTSVPPLKCPRCKINHRTGRRCEVAGCEGYLMNTIINFGDYLENEVILTAEIEARKADSVLVLGSTLRVSPANSLVTRGPAPNRIMLCNRQTTPYDDDCEKVGPDGDPLGCRVFGDCDKLMMLVMKKLLPANEYHTWVEGREV